MGGSQFPADQVTSLFLITLFTLWKIQYDPFVGTASIIDYVMSYPYTVHYNRNKIH